MTYDEEFIQEVTEATNKGLAVPYATERLLRIIRQQQATIKGLMSGQETLQKYIEEKNAEIARLQGMVNAELDTVHKLGDDYGRALEEHSIITGHLNAEIDRLHSIIKEMAGD